MRILEKNIFSYFRKNENHNFENYRKDISTSDRPFNLGLVRGSLDNTHNCVIYM